MAIFPKIVECKHSKEAWETLQSSYNGYSMVRVATIQILQKDFESLMMNYDETIDVLMNIVHILVIIMHVHSEVLNDTKIMEKVLRSLPNKFDLITISIEDFIDLSQLH